ncbi:MAG: TolC family protein [Chitinophagaceae bacterium]
MKKLVFIFFILMITKISFAQIVVNDELKKLINQSFSYFPKIKEAENNVITAQQRIDITQTNLPDISASGSYTYIKPKIEIPFPVGSNGEVKNFQFFPVNNVASSVDANYMLFDFGRLKANVDRAKTDLKYAADNVEYSKTQLAYQVADIYYGIIYLQKAIGIQDSVLSYLNANKQIVESNLRNGTALKIDLLNVQSNIDAEQNRKVDLQNSLQKQYNLLSYATGAAQAVGSDFDFNVSVKTVDEALAVAQQNNIEFILAKDKIAQAQSDVTIQKSINKPSVNLHGGAGYKNGFVPDVNQIRFNYQAGVTLKVPIYDGGKTDKQIKLYQNIVRQNQLSMESLSNDYKRDIEQTFTDIESNVERIKNTAGQIEQAKLAEQIAQSRFRNGVGTNLEITNASTNEQRAELTRLQYEYQLCLAKVELARLIGEKYW